MLGLTFRVTKDTLVYQEREVLKDFQDELVHLVNKECQVVMAIKDLMVITV